MAVRSVTKDLVTSIMLDDWPRMAARVDFGLDTQRHYEALYDPIRTGQITEEDLDAVLGDGPALTALVNSKPANRHPGIVFKTAWDNMPQEDRTLMEINERLLKAVKNYGRFAGDSDDPVKIICLYIRTHGGDATVQLMAHYGKNLEDEVRRVLETNSTL